MKKALFFSILFLGKLNASYHNQISFMPQPESCSISSSPQITPQNSPRDSIGSEINQIESHEYEGQEEYNHLEFPTVSQELDLKLKSLLSYLNLEISRFNYEEESLAVYARYINCSGHDFSVFKIPSELILQNSLYKDFLANLSKFLEILENSRKFNRLNQNFFSKNFEAFLKKPISRVSYTNSSGGCSQNLSSIGQNFISVLFLQAFSAQISELSHFGSSIQLVSIPEFISWDEKVYSLKIRETDSFGRQRLVNLSDFWILDPKRLFF